MTDSCYLMHKFKESIFLPYRLSASKARAGIADQNAIGYVSQDLHSRDTALWFIEWKSGSDFTGGGQMWSGCNDELMPIIWRNKCRLTLCKFRHSDMNPLSAWRQSSQTSYRKDRQIVTKYVTSFYLLDFTKLFFNMILDLWSSVNPVERQQPP